MAIVFVHGVNTRSGPSYDAETLATRDFLRRHLHGATIGAKSLPGIPDVSFPYWGDFGTKFAWQMASLPRSDMQALGGAVQPDLQGLVAHWRDALPAGSAAEPLTSLAHKRFSLAVDVINQLALDATHKGQEAAVATFTVQSSAYAESHPVPAWLAKITTDAQLIATLTNEVSPAGQVQAQGPLSDIYGSVSLACARFKQAVQSATGAAIDRTGDFASTRLLGWAREPLNATLGRFFGDVFVYLDSRGDRAAPGPIPQLIIDYLDRAHGMSPTDEPLIVIGHSLGGVIAFDLLSYFRPDINVDLFVSVGSQVAHFEEMKLYRGSDPKVQSPQRAPRPPNIRAWINVFDEVDIFAYAAERVFSGVDVDARYDTQTYTIKAHGMYFQQDRFYGRLRARVDKLP